MSQRSISVSNLTKNYRIGNFIFGTRIRAVDNISFTMQSDDPWILSIVGESGCGKTTLAKMLLKSLAPSSGEIKVDDIPLKDFNKGKRSKEYYKRVQTISQNPFSAFSPRRTVDCYLFETARNLTANKKRDAVQELIEETLQTVGLSFSHIKGKYPNQFSGGELQRISVARAMLPRPEFIVADEPVAMIDASLRMNVINTFKLIKEKHNTNFIYITHDLSTADYISDYVAIMYRGNIVEFGPAKEVFSKKLHPYTELLIDSIPTIGKKWTGRKILSGIETKEYTKKGCKFISRCPYAKDICATVFPIDSYITQTHRVACHKFSDNPDF